MKTLLAAFLLALASVAHAQITGVVVGVPDGDTLAVKIDERVLKINLRHIDAPAVGQPLGAEARDSLAELCDSKTIELDELGIDRNRHIFGAAECDGVDAATEQVRRGYASVRADKTGASLRDVESQAKAEHKGLWSEPAAAPATVTQ